MYIEHLRDQLVGLCAGSEEPTTILQLHVAGTPQATGLLKYESPTEAQRICGEYLPCICEVATHSSK